MRPFPLLLAALAATPAAAEPLPADPLDSPMWAFVADQAFGADARVRFDPRLKVSFPSIAENQRVFPVQVDARGIAGVRRIVILVDLNPIQLPIDYRPTDAEASLMPHVRAGEAVAFRARDTNGTDYRGTLPEQSGPAR